MNVKDNVAVVTGGASGIGLGRCSGFAKEGAHVVLSDLSQESCEREAAPIGAFPVAADVGREEDIENLVAATIDHFGRLDLFVSNAGISIDGGIDTPTEKWQKIIGVNLMWLVVHLGFITGFKNRLAALANWVVAFVGRARRQRTITKQQVFARDHDLESPSAERNRPETQREKAGER